VTLSAQEFWFNKEAPPTHVMCGETYIYGTVTNPTTGETWLDKNLGAEQVATAIDDHLAYGALFQWGRLIDGHECISWTSSSSGTPDNGTTSTLSTTDDPGHNLFITNSVSPFDWRSPSNDNLWQGAGGTNNPCPDGYRVPTKTEWENEKNSWSGSAFDSHLKLVVAGLRNKLDGGLLVTGWAGYYWSSSSDSPFPSQSYDLAIYEDGSPPFIYSDPRSAGFSVRCIKD
jgi:uncharacterized protein (TIGR02145 family)